MSQRATIGTAGEVRVVFAGCRTVPKADTTAGDLRVESPWTILHNF